MEYKKHYPKSLPDNYTEKDLADMMSTYLEYTDKSNGICVTTCLSCYSVWNYWDEAASCACCNRKKLTPSYDMGSSDKIVPNFLDFCNYWDIPESEMLLARDKFPDVFEWFETKCKAYAINQMYNDKAKNTKGTLVANEYFFGIKGQNEVKDNTLNIKISDKDYNEYWEDKRN